MPIRESIHHIDYALKSIGIYSLISGLIFFLWISFDFAKGNNHPKASRVFCLDFLGTLNWESLWLGISPLIFLIVRGAGLNSLVAMPSAFGIVMFLIDPLVQNHRILSHQTKDFQISGFRLGGMHEKLLVSVVAVLFLLSSVKGLNYHINPDAGDRFKSMGQQTVILQSIMDDVKENQVSDFVYVTTSFLSSVHDCSLENILFFDYLANKVQGSQQIVFPPLGYPPQTFNRIHSLSDWQAIPVSTDTDKIDYLVKKANQDIDYLILPDEQSTVAIAGKLPYVIVNRHADEIRNRVLSSGIWIPIGDIIQTDNDESIQVYRNQMRIPGKGK